MAVKTSEIKAEKKEVAKKQNSIFVNIASFVYKGNEPYFFKDEKGVSYEFKKDDVIFINESEAANYFDYKKTLFERIKNA